MRVDRVAQDPPGRLAADRVRRRPRGGRSRTPRAGSRLLFTFTSERGVHLVPASGTARTGPRHPRSDADEGRELPVERARRDRGAGNRQLTVVRDVGEQSFLVFGSEARSTGPERGGGRRAGARRGEEGSPAALGRRRVIPHEGRQRRSRRPARPRPRGTGTSRRSGIANSPIRRRYALERRRASARGGLVSERSRPCLPILRRLGHRPRDDLVDLVRAARDAPR